MSSLRNFRFQKTKPVTTSPSETGSEGLSISQSPQVSQDYTQDGSNSAKHSEESSEDIVPPVR